MPNGYGVFIADGWFHCGKVKDGIFQEGRMVSVNELARILKLTTKKFLSDGSVNKKIEESTPSGLEQDFFKDGQKLA